jgi:hypothetical protein
MASYSQYSEHRRTPAVPKVRRVENLDATGADDLKIRNRYEKALDASTDLTRAANAPKKKSFAALLKKK